MNITLAVVFTLAVIVLILTYVLNRQLSELIAVRVDRAGLRARCEGLEEQLNSSRQWFDHERHMRQLAEDHITAVRRELINKFFESVECNKQDLDPELAQAISEGADLSNEQMAQLLEATGDDAGAAAVREQA